MATATSPFVGGAFWWFYASPPVSTSALAGSGAITLTFGIKINPYGSLLVHSGISCSHPDHLWDCLQQA
jgi:hypothetical protein